MSSGMDDSTVAAHMYSSSSNGGGGGGLKTSAGCRSCGDGRDGSSTGTARHGSDVTGVPVAVIGTPVTLSSSRFIVSSVVPFAWLLPETTSCNHPRTRFRYTVRAANMSWPHGRTTSASPPSSAERRAAATGTATRTPRPHQLQRFLSFENINKSHVRFHLVSHTHELRTSNASNS